MAAAQRKKKNSNSGVPWSKQLVQDLFLKLSIWFVFVNPLPEATYNAKKPKNIKCLQWLLRVHSHVANKRTPSQVLRSWSFEIAVLFQSGINWAFKLQHQAVGISYFRKPHLHVKQHEVVIWCELIVARLGVTMRHNVKQSCAEWMVRQLLLHSL